MSKVSSLVVFYIFLMLLGATPAVAPMLVVPALQPSWVQPLSTEQDVIASHLAEKYSKPKSLLSRIVSAAYKEGAKFGIPPLTLLAIMEKESGFRHDVVNGYGAVGLMQVVPRFHRDKVEKTADEQLKTPENNIHVGTRILAEYLAVKNGNLKEALKKYSGNAHAYAQRVAYFQDKLAAVRAREKV